MKFIDLTTESKEIIHITGEGLHVLFAYNKTGKVTISIENPKAEVELLGVYVGKNHDNFKLETVQRHTKKGGGKSNLLIKGIFYDNAKLTFEGLIRIEKNAHGSHAYLKNQNLMLSKDCFIDTRPFLEILADDVFCTHAATTGRLNQDQIHYMQTRGIPKEAAEQMLSHGFIEDIFQKAAELGIEEEIRHYKEEIFAEIKNA